jgi:hypothetical protein
MSELGFTNTLGKGNFTYILVSDSNFVYTLVSLRSSSQGGQTHTAFDLGVKFDIPLGNSLTT